MFVVFILPLLFIQILSNQFGPTQNILSTKQFYFIPNSSYFQFRISSTQLGRLASLSKVECLLNFDINNYKPKGILYNIIVLPPRAQSNINFALYNCYMRAAFQGVSNPICSQNIVNMSALNGSCQQCVQNATKKSFPIICLGCSISFSASILQDFNQFPRGQNDNIDSNLVMIIDNTKVISTTGIFIEMNISYNIDLMLNESDQTIVLFFLGLLIVMIVIALVFAIYLTYKIKQIKVVINNYSKVQ